METHQNLWEIERQYREQGVGLICGVDEAGAGPLAGPVYAAAVILPFGLVLEGLDDSKKIKSERRREQLYELILDRAVGWAVSSVDEGEIDRINILNARMAAMDRAVRALDPAAELALVDGNQTRGIRCACVPVVKGDGRSANIAAASILAKVSRDRCMARISEQYPQYRFERHKGYGTALHYEMLQRYGPAPVHRKSFLKKWLQGAPADGCEPAGSRGV